MPLFWTVSVSKDSDLPWSLVIPPPSSPALGCGGCDSQPRHLLPSPSPSPTLQPPPRLAPAPVTMHLIPKEVRDRDLLPTTYIHIRSKVSTNHFAPAAGQARHLAIGISRPASSCARCAAQSCRGSGMDFPLFSLRDPLRRLIEANSRPGSHLVESARGIFPTSELEAGYHGCLLAAADSRWPLLGGRSHVHRQNYARPSPCSSLRRTYSRRAPSRRNVPHRHIPRDRPPSHQQR